jgi:hypothetical protein
MREVYVPLAHEFSNDEQWRRFIYAAWAARNTYSRYRDAIKWARKVKGEIAETAEKLAELLWQIGGLGINCPSEFFSIPSLLENTDNMELRGQNLYMWRVMRRHVLGYPQEGAPERESPQLDLALPPTASDTVFELSDGGRLRVDFVSARSPAEIEPVEQARSNVGYAWTTAPDFPALLNTVVKAARDFEPRQTQMIGAAIASRKQNPKTDYLRAFAHLLTDVHHLTPTTPIMRAMAVVATVVVNLPDIDVTYDDVRKALERLSGESLEDLGAR